MTAFVAIRKLRRMRPVACILTMTLTLTLGPACAAQTAAPQTAIPVTAAERDYLAARDAAIAAIKIRFDSGKPDDALSAADSNARAALDTQLRAIIGVVTVAGFGPAKINLDTLMPEMGFGQLDGLVVASADAKSSVIVTTVPLLMHWLRGHRHWWGARGATMPQDIAGAARSEAFYTQATASGAATVAYGTLAVTKPSGVRLASAILAARTQDLSPPAPDQIFVVLEKDGRVAIANAPLAQVLAPDMDCAALRARFAARANAAFEAYRASGLKDTQQYDRSTALEQEGDRAQRRCFAEKLPAAARAQATQQAQALIDALTGALPAR